jgi:hypothetical protein
MRLALLGDRSCSSVPIEVKLRFGYKKSFIAFLTLEFDIVDVLCKVELTDGLFDMMRIM